MRIRVLLVPLVGAAAWATAGCAAIGLTLLSIGAGVGTGTGVSYTLDSIAYKTFAEPEDRLRMATLKTLKRLAMDVKENKSTESGRYIVALAGDRTINIELERLTPKTSRMRVNAKRGIFLKDRATATEVIIQTERTLEDEPELTQQPRPSATPVSRK